MKRHKRWIRITECVNIPLREGRSVKVAGRDVAIFNLGDRFLAVENRCPHKDGPLSEGIVSGTTVVCPLHAWKIDLATGTTIGASNVTRCVETFDARVEDGFVLLGLPVESQVKEEVPGACIEQEQPTSWLEAHPTANV